MKIRLMGVFILFLFLSAQTSKKEVVCIIELETRKSDKFGQIVSIVGVIKNQTNKEIYLNQIGFSDINIFKEENGDYIDFNEGWLSYNITDEYRDEMIEELGGSFPRISVYNKFKGEFTNSAAKEFYLEQKKDIGFVNSVKDSIALLERSIYEFEGIVFLKTKQEYRVSRTINSLPAGKYKLVYSFTNINDPRIKRIVPDLKWPDYLGGYERWTGTIVSDTLHLNIR